MIPATGLLSALALAVLLAVDTTNPPPTPVDWTTVLLALITAMVSIVSAVLAYLANANAKVARSNAESADTHAQEANDSSKATAKAVDGVKVELLAAVEGKARAEGMMVGQARAEGMMVGQAQAATVQAQVAAGQGGPAPDPQPTGNAPA